MFASVGDSPEVFFCILVIFHPHIPHWTFCFGKNCEARELNLNQTKVAPFQKHKSYMSSLETEHPKKPSCTLQDAREVPANTSTCSCLVWKGCASRVPSPSLGMWLGRQPGQQLVPIHPTCFVSAADCQPSPSPAGSFSCESPKALSPEEKHPCKPPPPPPSPSSYPIPAQFLLTPTCDPLIQLSQTPKQSKT